MDSPIGFEVVIEVFVSGGEACTVRIGSGLLSPVCCDSGLFESGRRSAGVVGSVSGSVI